MVSVETEMFLDDWEHRKNLEIIKLTSSTMLYLKVRFLPKVPASRVKNQKRIFFSAGMSLTAPLA